MRRLSSALMIILFLIIFAGVKQASATTYTESSPVYFEGSAATNPPSSGGFSGNFPSLGSSDYFTSITFRAYNVYVTTNSSTSDWIGVSEYPNDQTESLPLTPGGGCGVQANLYVQQFTAPLQGWKGYPLYLWYTNSPYSNATRLIYVVSATDSAGNTYSWPAPSVSLPPDSYPPTGATSLSGQQTGNTSVSLSWTYSGSDSPSWNLYYWDTTAGQSESNATEVQNVTSPYSLSGLTAGDTYSFYVQPYTAGGAGNASNIVTIALQQTTPNGSTVLSGTIVNSNTDQLTWTNNSTNPVTGYNLFYWDTTAGQTQSNATEVHNVTSPYQVTNLNEGDTYSFYVVPYNTNGNGNPSNIVTLTTGASTTGLSISPGSATIQVGGSQSYTVSITESNGSIQDVTSSASIASSNANIASISGATATGVSTGTVTITATYDGMTATATLTVGPTQTPPTPPNPPTVPPMSTSGDIFHQLIDTALGPVTNFLQYAIQKMNSISQIAAQGIDLDNYLGPIGVLGPPWTTLVTSLLAALLLIIIVFIARQVYNLYLALKSGVKWW
ncbi:MAG: fibronectin type III domain-containing protein [Thermoplasmatales archaeon]